MQQQGPRSHELASKTLVLHRGALLSPGALSEQPVQMCGMGDLTASAWRMSSTRSLASPKSMALFSR